MKIIGTGSAMPSMSVTNDMLSQFLDTSDDWITTRTGIKQRRIITNETLKDLAITASQKALDNAGIAATDLDFILCSNVINNYVTPALSCMIQGGIDATCPCIDLNGACSGFIYALDIASAYLETGRAENVLIVCAEQPTRLVNWSERNTCVLFGDGAAAVVVSKGDNLKSLFLTTQCKVDALYYQRKMEFNPYVRQSDGDMPLVMNGKDVFKLAVSSSISDIKTVLAKAELDENDISYFLLHQANMRILDSIKDYFKQTEEKFPHNIEKYGNTSSASIPILLDEMNCNNQLQKGDYLLLSAFGAGFTSGACIIQW